MLTSLRAILRGAARSLGVERAAYAALIEEMWPEIVGAEAAAHSRPAGLRGSVLLAEVESGMWTQELSAQRGRFTTEVNRRLGAQVLTEMRFRRASDWTTQTAGQTAAGAAVDKDPEAGGLDLTSEEVAAVERAASEIADPEVREAARRAMVSQLKWRKRHVRPSGR